MPLGYVGEPGSNFSTFSAFSTFSTFSTFSDGSQAWILAIFQSSDSAVVLGAKNVENVENGSEKIRMRSATCAVHISIIFHFFNIL